MKKEKDDSKSQKSVQFKLGGTIGQFDNVNNEHQNKQQYSPIKTEDLPNSLKKQKEKDELEIKKSYMNIEDIISDSSSNKHIIYKFMKKGFTALTAEEMACTMVNPTFTVDFKKNTKEDWNINYQSKVIEKLQRCKFHMHWFNKQVSTQGYDNLHEEFMKTVAVGDLDKVFKYLRKNNIEEVLNSVEEKSKRSPLHIAAKNGHMHLIEFFLNKNANIEARDKLLKTALHYACENGHTLAVKLLMENNADPFEKDNCGRTALHYAVYSGKTDVMALLTQHNTDIIHIKDHAGRTPLHHAVFMEANQVLIIQKLLNYGADVNSLDLEKRTPLHHAAESGKSRIIPILIQRGAQTFLKDSLTNKTPLELAANDHIKEMIIAYCQPQYMPNDIQINKMESKRYADINVNKKGQIERSLQNQNLEKPLSQTLEKPKKKKVKIDQQSQESIQQNTQLQIVQEVDKGLGPVSAWEKQKEEFIPYNIRNYQDRLMTLLRRIQKFGVESFIYQKKPYLYTGSWMEYVRNLDDLMLQINGVNPNEASMKIFNILFPYPEPLPLGKGDESALTGFFDGKAKINVSQEQRECLPEQLLENIQKNEQQQTEQTIRNNELGNVQDLLDIRQEVVQLRSANNALQFMVDQKDEMITKLKYFQSLDNDEKYLKLQMENQKLQDQLNKVIERNADLEEKLVNLKLLKNDNTKNTEDGENNKNLINIIDKLIDKQQDETQNKRSKASRIRAIKSVSKSKESRREKNKKQIRTKIQEQIFLDDEQTLQKMLQKLQKDKKGDLKQRLIKIAGSDKGLISEKHFQTLIKDQMKMTYNDFIKLQRSVGFGDNKKESKLLKLDQIINNVNDILEEVEQIRNDVFQKVSSSLKEQGLNLEESFKHFDQDEAGSFDVNQLQDGFNQLNIEVSEFLNLNLFTAIDKNGDGNIDFKEFQTVFQKYYNEENDEDSEKNQEERLVSFENVNEYKQDEDNQEEENEDNQDEQMQQEKDEESGKNEEVKNEEGQNEGVEVEEIVEDDNSNQMTNKQKLDEDDFDTIQDIPDEDLQVQEEKRVQDIKNGKIKSKLISGELILKIKGGDNFANVKGKEQYAFEISMPRYNQKGKQIPQKGVAKLGLYSSETKRFKIKPMRIKISEQNLFLFSEIIVINVYKIKQDETNFELANKTYIGSAQLCWKESVLMVFKGISPSREFRLQLKDNQLINTNAEISGQLNGEIVWVNFGHEKSYFDQNGIKKEKEIPAASLKPNLNPIQKNNTQEDVQKIILTDLVNNEDKVDHKTLKVHLEKFFKSTGVEQDKFQDNTEAIKKIFNKITDWKKQMGDSEQQEQIVSENLKPNKSLKIHNINTALDKMNQLKKLIGLTDKESYFIIFSSIDHEYFNHLLLQQGEFIKWFTINFEERQGEEEDFLKDANEQLNASIQTAFQIYEALGDTPESIQEETIMTYQWWQKERFRPLGSFLFQQFKRNPKLKQDLKDEFKNHGDKISYYDFFEFLENQLNSGKDSYKPKDWEKDAIEMRLDKMGLAFIDFNEFRKFCKEYNIELGESLNQENQEEIIEMQENVSNKNYQITEKDKFQGSSTMFKNEKAALKTAYNIYNELKNAKKDRFLDPDFGPKNANDKDGSSNSLYIGGVVPQKGYVEPSEISWVYADELCEKGQTPKFILGGAAANDCRQGELGNCWFMSALSVVCQRDELIVGGMEGLEYDPDMIVDKEISTNLSKGIFPPIFHKFRSKGIYVLRYFKDFKWIYVIIDERLPVKNVITDQGKELKLVFGGCKDPQEMWVQLIEKGYAKLHGCYGNLISGYIDEGIQELTGFQPEKILLRNEHTGNFPHKQIEHYGKDAAGFWVKLKNWKEDGCLMGCSIKGYGKEGPLIIDGHPTGLILNHAYGIRDIIELPDYQGKIQQLIFLRNPWGKGEWTGAWSEQSEEYQNNLKSLEKYNETLDFDEKINFEKKQDDGSFFIHFDEWKDLFSTLFINLDFPEKWTGVRFKSYWTNKNSTGLPTKYQDNLLKEYAKNPQFMIKTTQETEIMFSLTQTGGRLPINGKYYKYPFGETLNNACVALFKLENNNQTFLKQFKKEQIQYMSPIKRERENSGRVLLAPNETYIIVAACELKGTLGEFHLSIYINTDLRDCEIKRVYPDSYEFTKEERKDYVLPEFIPEEAEKILRAPTWKLALVRDMIPFMMTEDDKEVKDTD